MTLPATDIAGLRFDARLAAFLRGQLSRREASRFLDLLRSDPDLRSQAIATARLTRALAEIGTEADREVIDALSAAEMPGVEAIAVAAAGPPGHILRRRRILLAACIAALIAIIVAGIMGYRHHEYQRLADLGRSHIAFTISPEIARSVDTPFSPALARIYSDIKSSPDLSASISSLEALWGESLSEELNAQSYAMPEIGWMLANAYLIHGNKPQALIVLDRLAGEFPEGSAMGDRSRALRAMVDD